MITVGDRKPAFADRSDSELRGLDRVIADNPGGLVSLIDSTDHSKALIIGCEQNHSFLTPAFYRRGRNGSVANKASRRRHFRSGYFKLNQPLYVAGDVRPPKKPCDVIKEDFDKLLDVAEEELFWVGYEYRPVKGGDHPSRVVPIKTVVDGARIYSHTLLSESGEPLLMSSINVSLDNAERADSDGASVKFEVPSRSTNKFYKGKLEFIPVSDKKGLVLGWTLATYYDREEDRSDFFYWGTKSRLDDMNLMRVLPFSAHCVAASYAAQHLIIREFKNRAAFDFSPILTPSKELVAFSKFLRSNMLVYDPNISESQERLRKPDINETCVLLMRKARALRYDGTFWDKSRDGSLRTYDWSVPGSMIGSGKA
ncbi:MAG: hypothetical protein AABW73_04520 [Nanoarchaeota archaeon]